eukprot:169155-Pleurochrysis_carterae.AAC.6
MKSKEAPPLPRFGTDRDAHECSYLEVNEDQLPTWSPTTKRAFKVIDMMRARSCALYNQQNSKALNSGTKQTLETFAPAARSATFKQLGAVGCIANHRVRQFDVDAAYLQGYSRASSREMTAKSKSDHRRASASSTAQPRSTNHLETTKAPVRRGRR